MLRYVVLCTLVAACVGQQCCSADDRRLIQEEWNAIWNTPDAAAVKIAIGRAIFDRFLVENPDAASLFDRVNVADPSSGEFNAHMLRVLGGLDMLINMLTDTKTLEVQLEHLAGQHAVREGITLARMKSFLEIISYELPKIMGEYNTSAWKACFSRFFERVAGR